MLLIGLPVSVSNPPESFLSKGPSALCLSIDHDPDWLRNKGKLFSLRDVRSRAHAIQTDWEQSCFYFILFFIFNWRVIALQCVDFCHTTMWIIDKYAHVPSLLNLLPTSPPSHFSRMLQSARLRSMCYTSNFPLAVLHMVIYTFRCYSLNLSTFSFPTSLFSTSASLVLGRGFPGGSDGKESACNVGETGLIPGSGRSPGEGNGNLFQYSCLENPMDRGDYRVQSMNWQRIRHAWAATSSPGQGCFKGTGSAGGTRFPWGRAGASLP